MPDQEYPQGNIRFSGEKYGRPCYFTASGGFFRAEFPRSNFSGQTSSIKLSRQTSVAKMPIMLKLAISGAAGRMGCALIRAVAEGGDFGSGSDSGLDSGSDSGVNFGGVEVSVATEHEDSPFLGKDAGAVAGCGDIGVPIICEAGGDTAAGRDFDLMLEFTTPAATLADVERCRKLRRGMVIGTTGINAEGENLIRRAAADIPIVLAANTSIGVNLCLALLETAGKVLGPLSDIEIVEAHHRHKVDAPSGTALLLAEAVAKPLGKDLTQHGVFTRHGHTGKRKPGSIGFSTIRGGDIAGEHTVMFIGDSERVEITHKATDRKIFASGAIKAAVWVAGQPAGLYGMRDVLGLGG